MSMAIRAALSLFGLGHLDLDDIVSRLGQIDFQHAINTAQEVAVKIGPALEDFAAAQARIESNQLAIMAHFGIEANVPSPLAITHSSFELGTGGGDGDGDAGTDAG